jgi:hypothetical protein
MAQLKTKDGTPKPEPTCFKYGDSARLGFTFELVGKNEIFAPHSFLARIELKDGDEIAFHYTYGVVRVIGRKLDDIFGQIKGQSIGILRRSDPDDPCREEIEIREIIFEEAMVREMDKLL